MAMAMAATLQSSVVAGSVTRLGWRTSAYSLPRRHALSGMRIRCQAEEKPSEQAAAETQPSQTPPPPATKPTTRSTAATTTTTAAATKVSNKFSDVLAFSGPAPERINGRLAMVGFVSAIAVEAARGDDLIAQLMNGGLPWFLGTAAVLSAASLVPLFRGVSVQSRSQGLMNSDAELWNGRFAMLGLVALAFTEYLKGGPLV